MGRACDQVVSTLLVLMACACFIPHIRAKQTTGTEIIGKRQQCNNEGEPVPVHHIQETNKCFTCICKNGFVECSQDCPVIEGCHYIVQKKPKDCCSKCRGCYHSGVMHASGTEWTLPGEPCRVFRCEAGIITESNIQCYTPCRRPLLPQPGKCCATCPGCNFIGQNVTKERDVTIPEDPCVKCHCEGSHMSCVKKACPVLLCHPSTQIKLPTECCPRCVGRRVLIEVKQRCLLGLGINEVLKDEERIKKDQCTHCHCRNETAICKRQTCPVLECDQKLQKTKPGECCPECPPVEEIRSGCTIGGITYKDGESWQLDPCKSCMCHRGEPRCAMQRCISKNDACPPGFKSIKRPGQCCSECVENDGVCTVFGDPHYKTYDGKFYSFQGSCKYLLSEDCKNHTFSIRVTNDARNTRYYAWTRTVSLKVGDLRINLGQKLRVKVNGKRVEQPFGLDRVRIERRNGSVFVNTHIGVNVLWDGGGLLEVSVPAAYKEKLCGLCGNYNSLAHDDLTTKRGKALTDSDVYKFGNSWRVGGKRACGRQNEHPTYKKQQCKPKNGKNPCKYLKDSNQFSGCDSKLNPHNYYEACLQDMCECPSGNCYCEALTAYAHECARLGVFLPDWRKDTRCRPGTGGRRSKPRQQLGYVVTPYPVLPSYMKPSQSRNHTRSPRPPIK